MSLKETITEPQGRLIEDSSDSNFGSNSGEETNRTPPDSLAV